MSAADRMHTKWTNERASDQIKYQTSFENEMKPPEKTATTLNGTVRSSNQINKKTNNMKNTNDNTKGQTSQWIKESACD